MNGTEQDWINAYVQKGALWIHSGAEAQPHALLTSGMHSNGFFNSRLIIQDEELLRQAAADLAELFRQREHRWAGCVVGPQTGATKLAEFLSEFLSHSIWASPAKSGPDEPKSMVLSAEDALKVYFRRVLLCEDVVTTGASTLLTIEAVTRADGGLFPYLLTLVNRSGHSHIGDCKILALIDKAMPIWSPEECPLCLAGSEPIRPKDPDNWARLNAQY